VNILSQASGKLNRKHSRRFCIALAALFVLASSKAYPWRGNNDGRLQLEREQLHSQEEQKREIGRAKRRDELERDKNAASKEREAVFGAIIDSSDAALRAPQGSFFRKVGSRSSGVPEGRTVVVGGVT
jgi:hypothetical protein